MPANYNCETSAKNGERAGGDGAATCSASEPLRTTALIVASLRILEEDGAVGVHREIGGDYSVVAKQHAT